jgi:excisionase family DNA binding protein
MTLKSAPEADLLTPEQVEFLTQEQAAKLLTVSPATLQDWRVRGGGPPFARIGRLIRYMRADLLAWSAARTVHPKPDSRAYLAPTLLAVEVGGDDGSSGHISTWCPWCERVHRNGIAGGGGNRAPHCHSLSASPLLTTGYDLDIAGTAVHEVMVRPEGLRTGVARLYEALNRAAPDLRRVTIQTLLGLASAAHDGVSKRFAEVVVCWFGSSRWRIERDGTPRLEGDGFLRLASELYGVPAGVAAVRILEATTADTLDAEAALTVQRAIDDWVQRGAPKRGDVS